MGWFGWLVVLGLMWFGWFAYRELKAMEAEILQDIQDRDTTETGPATEIPTASGGPVSAAPEPVEELEQLLLRLIADRPGILQSTVYAEVKGFGRKQVQQALLELARNGRIRRERAKGSYLLYPG